MKKGKLSTISLQDKPGLDNLLFFPGGDYSLSSMVCGVAREYNDKIDALERKKETYTTKTVKGNIYWYEYVPYNGGYKYTGKADPRIAIDKRIANIQEKAKKSLAEFNSLVLEEVKGTPILYRKILKHPGFTAKRAVIPVLELLSKIHQALGDVSDNKLSKKSGAPGPRVDNQSRGRKRPR